MSTIKYAQFNDSDLVVETNTRKILLSLFGNIYFQNPTPSLAVYSAAIEDFSDTCVIADTGSVKDLRSRDLARKTLISLTKKLYGYVTTQANGDVTILATSGFPLVKKREPMPPLAEPSNLKVANAGSGFIVVSVDLVKNAKMYFFQYTTDPSAADNWESVPGTKRKQVLSNLHPGTKYWIRVMACGVRDEVTYSVVTSIICS